MLQILMTTGFKEFIMSEPTMYDKKRFDKRLIERHLKGEALGGALEMARITPEELQAHLDALPDLASECEPVTIKQPIVSDSNETDVAAD